MKTDWSVLSEADLARLRYSLMRELAWIEWDNRPAWWWRKEHRTLLDVKQTTSTCPQEQP